jgi:hypothetical protein
MIRGLPSVCWVNPRVVVVGFVTVAALIAFPDRVTE